jgi:hypothetical protein
MPQPKKPTGQGAPTADDDPRSTLAALRDLLFLPRDRVRETLDDAVRRGRITRADAEELVDRFMELGRQQSDDVFSRIERLVPGGGPVVRAVKTVDRARRGVGGEDDADGLAIEGYDELTAAAVTSKLDGLDEAQLRLVHDYEKRNANRKSVLAAVEKRLR